MGNTCEACQQYFPAKKNQQVSLTLIKTDQQFYAVEMPKNDIFFKQYLASKDWHRFKKPLKKNFKLNKYFYGDWQNGLPQGKGILYQPGNILIDSYFAKGVPHSNTKIYNLSKQTQFRGDMIDGKMNGFGTYIDNKQLYKFEGFWINSAPSKGTLTLMKDGNIEKVEFINFQQKYAKIYYNDGRIYEGEINISKLIPQGKGKVIFTTFDVKDYYQGEWKNGMYHGMGQFYWKNGQRYVGRYQEGQKYGIGKFTFISGNQYEGNWLNGKQQGMGTMYDRNGFPIKQGEWKQGNFVGVSRFQNTHYTPKIYYEQNLDEIKQQQMNQSVQFNPTKFNLMQTQHTSINNTNKKSKQLTMAHIRRKSML